MKILGIETSCDETAIAIVDDNKKILSHIINSQIDLHQEFGGVVPELAARSHGDLIDQLIIKALEEANLSFADIDAFAPTCGPGLIGGVIVGMMAAKTLASIHNKPFLAINHLEAHALTVRLTNDIEFPYLLLLISGGHCQILLCQGLGNYKKYGETIDDALGEAFDKVAQMLGLNYPGGPAIEKLAKLGDENCFNFPKPLIDNKSHQHLCDFSFSGLKTAVRRKIEEMVGEDFNHNSTPQKISEIDKQNICASFQKTVVKIITNRLDNVLSHITTQLQPSNLVIAGGVAANQYILQNIKDWAISRKLNVIAPPIKLCTDNGAMIAWAGIEKMQKNKDQGNKDQGDSLNFIPKARWDISSD